MFMTYNEVIIFATRKQRLTMTNNGLLSLSLNGFSDADWRRILGRYEFWVVPKNFFAESKVKVYSSLK